MKIIKITAQFNHLKDALASQDIEIIYPADHIDKLESEHKRKGLFKYLVTETNEILYITDAYDGSHSQELHKFSLTSRMKEHALSAVCCFTPDMDKLYVTAYNRDYEKVKHNCVIFTNDEI